ncbi:MAG TPA: FliH/SctL family protein [Allosphingosinicella sp.]|jgi:flagellar assembly protein FliH|nr:FliH/SctL family protein [Allosphingosinicella sp.]
MSNLWSDDESERIASVGSFAIERGEPTFTPWGSGEEPEAGESPVTPLDLETVRAEAFARGREEGKRAAEIELAAERDAIARIAEALETLRPESSNILALVLAETVERLVRQIVGTAEIDRATLVARAEAAAALVADEVAPARLRLHPDDVPLLEGADIPVALAADPTLTRGSLILETGEGWIEDGPAVRLERLRAELDRMGAPE